MSGRRSDTSLAALLLAQRLVDTGAEPLRANEYWALLDVVSDPAALLGSDRSGVPAPLAERVGALLGGATALAFELERLEQSGLAVVSSFDEGYPPALLSRLGAAAPPLLYVAGSVELLGSDALGIVGSRDVTPAAAEVAQQAARAAVANDLAVVSGGAKGVDQLSMATALEAGGRVIGVLAESLARRVRGPDTRRAIAEEQVVLCTPYKPDAGFNVANAMGRNKVIYALSQTTFVVAADHDKGGTWAGAVEALRRSIAPVAVWTGDGAGPGNAALVERGGRAVPELDVLFPLEPTAPSEPRDQLKLDV
jgi:predicted Rossmann fold nucleotide-binding protein DprA/Smf involved in DNA uptake